MSSRKGWMAGSLLIVFLAFALVRFPVALAAGWLPKELRLDGSEGTLWHGRAAALGVGGMALQHDLTWQWQPQRLLHGELAWAIQGRFAAETSQLTLAISPSALELREARLALPLEPLLAQDAKLKPLRLGGLLKLNSARFSPQRPSELSARVENLFSALTPNLGALGSAQAQLTTQAGSAANWQVHPLEGALAISGSGTLNLQRGQVSGALAFKPDANLAGALRPVLSLMQQGANGEYTLPLAAR